MAATTTAQSAGDLAERLREWLEHEAVSDMVAELVSRTAHALDQIARGGDVDEDHRNGRHVTYKEVLAQRGERHRPDGTPLWPLRPDDFPSSYKNTDAGTPIRRAASGRLPDDLPDWML